LLAALSILVALLVAPFALYLLALTICSRVPAPTAASRVPQTRFRFVVPAHDEAAVIAEAVASLRAVDYPADRFAVVVVADNCTDDTAERARLAGARVLERRDPERRGKGHALAFAFDRLLGEAEPADAFVVVDADTLADGSLLRALDLRIAAGASALQVRYAVRNSGASWRTKLMTLALAMYHDLRSLARSRLRVSCGLRGNGMCFTRELLQRVPHRAFGQVEDVEYAVQLGLAGVPVHYVHDASVYGEMASSGRTAATQRQRWERGRARVRKDALRRLVAGGIRNRSLTQLELAMDLSTPPLSRLAAAAAVGWGVEGLSWAMHGAATPAAWVLGSVTACLGAYTARGAMLSGLGWRSLHVLAAAPVYVAWKVAFVPKREAREWVRTQRELRDGAQPVSPAVSCSSPPPSAPRQPS
jgi:cellulose synthase/poly-beta-1,6-N-acetylglucosamine synthase-like glycosyltransferase